MRVIPNGIDVARFATIARARGPQRPTVALIGRVVPIKDIKTFIRACGLLQPHIIDLEALVMGPLDEDEDYARECRDYARELGLERTITFTGKVDLADYLGRIDVIALTSISEGQPLVLLEAGAAGIPAVATDVGACREIILGREDETPRLGAGGVVTALSSPAATAEALMRLLTDSECYTSCSAAMRERVRRYYDKAGMLAAYREIYARLMAAPGRAQTGRAAWPVSVSR
jgi:glycosyltransferase involved in cell wall biosynthesis